MQIDYPNSNQFMQSKKSGETRTRQPFPQLPAYPVAATILAYFGYQKQSNYLLNSLSNITKLYAESHEKILKEFIIRRAPPKLYPFFGKPMPLSKFCKATDFAYC